MPENHTNAVDLHLMEPVFEAYRNESGALIALLQKAQEQYGYVPREVMELIARKTGVPLSRVYGVATFYAQFYLERRGRHVLRLCDGTACHVKGTPVLLTAIEDRYGIDPGETTDDGELTLEIVYCLGSCALAPVAVFDGEVMGRMRQEMLVRTLQKTVGGGEVGE